MGGVLWFLAFQALGIFCAMKRIRTRRSAIRLWLGSAAGSVAAIWLPVPYAFFLGFTAAAQLLALATGLVLTGAVLLWGGKPTLTTGNTDRSPCGSDRPLAVILPLYLLLGAVILFSHTLRGGENGLYTGQCSYGDMCMHLGFITSIGEQGFFPPVYSILPYVKMSYPFLCDTISASLYVLGTPLRLAYVLPMLFALGQVLCGVWFLAAEVCSRPAGAVTACGLFFLNGGFGTVYFLKGDYSWKDLLYGFYTTPTNLTEKNIRWVNVLADMLYPQRATLFGWAALFVCFWLLFRAVFRREEKLWLPAGLLGGLLPMIHTHSYLALGLVAFCWLVGSLLRDGLSRRWFMGWVKFGLPAVLLALPQLLEWTLQSAGGNSQFLRWHLDWVNGLEENFFLFWLKNLGPILLLFPFAWFRAGKGKRMLVSGSLFIFLLGELILFQPNPYDNNKLFYVGFLFVCILCGDWLAETLRRIPGRGLRTTAAVLAAVLLGNAAVLTLTRELISGFGANSYRLFTAPEVRAAEYIRENTEPDALFLTGDNHNNTVAVLTGRNILCGSPSYLYYHGLDYSATHAAEEAMLADPEVFEQYRERLGLDYVFMSPSELRYGTALREYLEQNYPTVFSEGMIQVFDVRGHS